MEKLYVSCLEDVSYQDDIHDLSGKLDVIDRYSIDKAPWPAYGYVPQTSFAISYTSDCILIKYYVKEEAVKAKYGIINEPVSEDSCVEFFISFDNINYYNFEFNCLGTCLAKYGKSRNDRKLLLPSVIEQIKVMTILGRGGSAAAGLVNWQLTIAMPFTVFSYDKIISLRGSSYKCNFYKCGDDTLRPHYLCWNNINIAKPDFHRPDFFGTVDFL